MESFKDKSIPLLVIKIADRLCNVQDFMVTDLKYAKKYLGKAEVLRATLFSKAREIGQLLGGNVGARIIMEYSKLIEDLNRMC